MVRCNAKRSIIAFICKCLCLALIITMFSPITSNAQPGIPLKDKNKVEDEDARKNNDQGYVNPREYSYVNVLKQYEKEGYESVEEVEISLNADDISNSNANLLPLEVGIGGKQNNVLVWKNSDDWFEWQIDIPESGLYNIYVEYYALGESSNLIQRELMIDGNVPFNEASNIPFYKLWEDEGKTTFNNVGDEVRPKQVEIKEWQVKPLIDVSGMYSQPLKFYFSEGKHTLRFNYVQQPMAIDKIIIRSVDDLPEYADISDEYKQKGYKKVSKGAMRIEGEAAYSKNDPTIRREYDGDPSVYPSAGGKIRLNMIGGWRWRKGNQEVTWKFDVPESGLYKLVFRVAQWYGDGLPVYRQIAIDGKVPFKEMEAYKFSYQHEWRTEELKDEEGNTYLFYLKEGEHTLTMTAKMGPLAKIINDMEEDAWTLSESIRDIIMITGSEPDSNFDYELDKKIPGLIDTFKELSNNMGRSIEEVTAISARRPMIVNNFAVLKDQLDEMIKDPFIIPRRLNDLMSSQSGLTLSLQDIQNQPLNIDYFLVEPPNANIKNYKASVLQKMKATWQNFLASFYKDYDRIDNVYSVTDDTNNQKRSIDVWIARGKEWGEVIKQKADEDFTPETGIGVNMNILPAGQMGATGVNALTLSIVSGKAPDVALGVDPLSPVELAIRDASANLAQFDDFNDVSKRFLPGVLVPFEYRNGIYALPETMDFNVLFYRKDIVDELGIAVPDTWEELYKSVLPVLNQNGMQFYYPSLLAASSSLLPFLYQNGAEFYTDDNMRSALDTSEAYKSFVEWTKLFKVYQIPVQANFFNRFRTGEMPIGVGSYNTYIMLTVAAPELYGRWGIAPLPGIRMEDGSIDRTAGGAPSAAIVLNQSENKEEAWQFLKWWTSTDTQSQFGSDIESLVGIEARWNTANSEAFKNIAWDKKDLAVFEEQWKWYKEQPVVLGGYFTDRHIKNAATSVIMSGMNERDALEKAIKDINKEMRNKQIEYGIIEEKR